MEITRDSSSSLVSGPIGDETVTIPSDLRTRPIHLTDNARTVLQKRYLRRGEDGKPAENEHEMFWRVAYNIALAEASHGGTNETVLQMARRFFEMLTDLRFFPNSPTFTGAGTPLGQLAACFTAGMRVTTSDGQKRIADLTVGDLVLTHAGRYRPVQEVYERPYSGELLRIKVRQIGTTVEVTPEHPILTLNGWVKAGEIKVGDQVAVGNLGETWGHALFDLAAIKFPAELEMQETADKIRVRRPSNYQNSGRQAEWVDRFIEVTPELARFCGYYIAEGTYGTDGRYIRFTFGKHEVRYHQDIMQLVEKLFGANATLHQSNHGNWVQIDVYNRPIAQWLSENFGTHSYGKRVPVWMQFADQPTQEQFLIGILRGDGLFYEGHNTIKGRNYLFRTLRLVLSNPELIHQIWLICLRLGYDASIRPTDTTYVTPTAHNTASINIPPRQAQDLVYKAFGEYFTEVNSAYGRSSVVRSNGQAYFTVQEVKRESFDGMVYNCEVDEDHTYVTEGVVVHNCFVLKIDDDMGRTDSGIFQTLRNAALIQQTGGGNGFAFSSLRPKGAIVKSSNGQATGPVGFLRVYDQAFGEIAQGGCLTPDTLVFTDKGLLRLDEIVTHNTPGWEPHTFNVPTDEGMRESTQAYNNGVAPVLKVTTDAGLQLTGTLNHKLKVMTDSGTVWRRFDELQPGDVLIVKLGQHIGTMQALAHPMQRHGNQVMPTFPAEINAEFAFFLGCLAGDGFVATHESDNRIGISVAHNSYLMDEMPALMKRLFGAAITVHCNQKEDDASVTFVIDNRAVKDFLAINGLTKAKSTTVQVPRLLRQSSPEIVGAFLRGLFEADGGLSHGYPQLLSTSEALIREVATLLIGLGCPVRVHQQTMHESHYGKTPMWTVRVNSFIGLNAWRERIGCDARSRFQACYEHEPDLAREYSYVLPHAGYWVEPVLAVTALPQIDKRGRGTGRNLRASSPQLCKELLRYTRGDRQLTVSGYARLRQEYAVFAEHARAIDDQWFVTIESVESVGESLTLDLEVSDNHTYLANGIVSHNSRRGANMAVLRVDHPDIREFIGCKTSESAITNFNISVGITDAFMRAVEAGTDYDLINPQDGKVWESIPAREIFDLIVKQAHHNGEPGVLFLDAANRQNPVPHLYTLESTNPCGEQFLGPFENCCLGSINLVNVVTGNGQVDWKLLQQLTQDATRFLDDVVTANKYVPAVPQLEEAAHRVRRIGLGIMGLGDLMYKLGVRYGSEEGQEFAGQITEFVRYHAMQTSIDLAKERGAFPAIKGSVYDPDHLTWQVPNPLFPYTRNWARPVLNWKKIVDGIKKHGIRNGAQLTVAPTGTIATVSGCEAYGCEPVFALAYIRHVNDKGRDLQLQYTSPLFEQALRTAGMNDDQIATIVEEVTIKGSCQDVPGVPERIRHTFVVSADISAEEHVRMQAAMQAFVDNAISKTCNFSEGATEADVAAVYKLSWQLGCKGMTVYVTGSRDKVVLETHATAQAKKEEAAPVAAPAAIPAPVPTVVMSLPSVYVKKQRPRELFGRTFQVGTPLGKTYVTINENGDGRGHPFEIFTHTSKAGSETAAVSEAIGRLISLILRLSSPITPRERLKEIIRQLDGIGGGRSTGFGPSRVRSLPDGIAQVLQEYMDETESEETLAQATSRARHHGLSSDNSHNLSAGSQSTTSAASTAAPAMMAQAIGDLCPECGEPTLINEEGCRKCHSCAYSEC